MVSSGMRVQSSADNAAYWSISTTMRSDRMAISAVADALGLSAAKVDTAYAGMSAVIDVLAEFKAKLVAAKEEGIDKAKIQAELDQLKEQVSSIATSSSFSGQNWLNTDVPDITDNDANTATVVSSFVRNARGSVAVNTTEFHLSKTSLFNVNGGGILQPDPRDLESIGGMRLSYADAEGFGNWTTYNGSGASTGRFDFNFSGPIRFDDPLEEIKFDVTVDADNPLHGLPGPLEDGKKTSIVINRTVVDAANSSLNGVISSFTQYIQVLNYALGAAGADASVSAVSDIHGIIIPNRIAFMTNQNRANGLNGSYVEVSGISSTTNSRGNLENNSNWGTRGSILNLGFNGFQNYLDGNDPDGVRVNFDFSINNAVPKSYSFDRTYVNSLFGKDSGKVETADEMVTLLQSLIAGDWPDLIIEAASPGTVTLRTDVNADRRAGAGTNIWFSNIDVSIEPIARLGFLDIDINTYPGAVTSYIRYIETVTSKAIEGASALGALSKRLEMQTEFAEKMMSTVDKGVGRLVDADMNEASTRLKALQVQEQLAIQSLSIANQNSENMMQLFR
jgi:flagellin